MSRSPILETAHLLVKAEFFCARCQKTFFLQKGAFGTHRTFCGRTEERFWTRITKIESGCWIFQGCKDKWGYAQYSVQRKRIQAHRYAYQLTHGPIPAGKLVIHSCDVPACVNPAHLRIGTHMDNMRDKRERGREARHDTNGRWIPMDKPA